MNGMSWVGGLLRHRPGRILGAAAGVALGVALLGALGGFVAAAKGEMTQRAISQVAVDWQVEVTPGADAGAVLDAVASRPGVRDALPVAFGATSGLASSVGGTTQSTGPGVVVGLPPGYGATFPGQLRTLVGSGDGVLLAQQAAANLHAGPGDTITVNGVGGGPVTVAVAGVVELPTADSLFQNVGAPPGAQASAPPDNVLLVPLPTWHQLFDPVAEARPDLVHHQVHVRLDHRLPPDPAAAFSRAAGSARRLEVDLTGKVVVGDNLGATLDAARTDALYAQVLFIVLGAPGAALAALLARAVVAAGRDRRRRELALLRLRGASVRQLDRFILAEALAVGGLGSVVGLVAGLAVGRLAFGSTRLGATPFQASVWAAASAGVGLLIAGLAFGVPARRDARRVSVAAARRQVGRAAQPWVLRYGLDLALLVAAGLVFWATSRSRYSVVVVPEGVPTVSVSYWALSGPILLWAGAGLFAWRVADTILGRGGPVFRRALRPVAGRLSGPVAATLRRQRQALAGSIVVLALTVAFAVSTAVFNATYRQQVEVDALLTNGAAVTVVVPPAAKVPVGEAARLAGVPGVGHVEPLQHRFVYVGNDLQDLYGVDPDTIGPGAKLQDAYFSGGSARQMLDRLRQQRDAVLVSEETVHDFQLHLGDRLRLRIRDAATGRLAEVDFHFAGVAREFPTAPRDSFVVANASYIAAQTGDPSPGTFLIQNHGASPTVVASRVRQAVGTGATVTDIDTSRQVAGSSLTAVDLAGLTRVELAYAVVLALAASGLVVGLGLAERRRTFAIIAALGARPRQVAAFARAEAAVVAVFGGVLGAAGGWLLAHMVVRVLTGVFDPPPAGLAVPWGYLAVVGLVAAVGLATATTASGRVARRPVAEELRDL
ncbi:MAG: putative transport system permease protein [Actinomycetota bacterium]|jgi:putative ABC transport system permease protein|nr:putative transport system permease protein [Actinomycetota bacterium]